MFPIEGGRVACHGSKLTNNSLGRPKLTTVVQIINRTQT